MAGTLYVSDLDGTLLNDDRRLSEYTLETLNRLIEEGMAFTCMTGRPYTTAALALKGLRHGLPMAVSNGAVLVNPADGQVLDACAMERARLLPLMKQFEACGASPMVFAQLAGRNRLAWQPHLATEGIRDYLARYPVDAHLAPVDSAEGLLEGEVYMLTFRSDRLRLEAVQRLVEAEAYLTHYFQQYDDSGENCWLEVNRCDGDKAGALRRLKARTGADEVVCFGDNLNDLPMFAEADQCYAVANACAEVRAAATGVIDGSNEDAVARWLLENG